MQDNASLVAALLFGKLDGLPPERVFLFARTGLIHLFSASGFHMAAALMVSQLAGRLARPWIRPRARAAAGFTLSLGLMTFFGIATDWSSPLVRAYTFTTLLGLARTLEIQSHRSWVFLLSLVAAALLGKGSTLSFSLSALGMAGILAAGRNAFALALAPWAFTLPLVVWAFGLFSFSAPLWNLTIGSLVSVLVLPPAILALLLEAVGLPAGYPKEFSEWAMEALTRALEIGDAYVGGSYWVPFPAFAALAVALGAATALRKNFPWSAMALAGATLAAAHLFPLPALTVLDVGQGDAILLRTAGTQGEETVLVDAGPPPRGDWPAPVNQALEWEGRARVNALLLTHLDRDHVGGAASLLARHAVGSLWLRESALEDEKAGEILAAAWRHRVPVRLLEAGAPTGLRCWLPPFTERNESSPFCHASLAGGHDVWLTGDAGEAAEIWLLATASPLPRAEAVKLGHHGSKGSSIPAFLRATGATTAFVSAGRKNRYGHPAPETLARAQATGMEIRRTDQEGNVRWGYGRRDWVAGWEARLRFGTAKYGVPAEARRP